ncbi:hypothetical protein [Streptomyces sp. NPDC096152]|uniref:hypothetical protein n=1 Tax=Streptomyces sp. NPDC096152 TaxID=3366078 RepID=UPI0037FB32B1
MADVDRLGVEDGQQALADGVVEDDARVLVGFEAADVDRRVPAAAVAAGGVMPSVGSWSVGSVPPVARSWMLLPSPSRRMPIWRSWGPSRLMMPSMISSLTCQVSVPR